MKTKIFYFFIAIFFNVNTYAQGTSQSTWNRILQTAQVEWNEVYSNCPNFPKGELNDLEFSKAIIEWYNNSPLEVESFYNISRIKKINPSRYYLGLPLNEEANNYKNSFVQWIKESNISDRRIMNLAPHFPVFSKDQSELNFNINRWKSLYGHEYENIINAEELVVLNPNYSKYINISQIPHFIGPLESIEKPLVDENVSQEEKLVFELKLMNWYFVFQNEMFYKEYGFTPEFPDFFDVAQYKLAIKQKIEETKRQHSLGNFESN